LWFHASDPQQTTEHFKRPQWIFRFCALYTRRSHSYRILAQVCLERVSGRVRVWTLVSGRIKFPETAPNDDCQAHSNRLFTASSKLIVKSPDTAAVTVGTRRFTLGQAGGALDELSATSPPGFRSRVVTQDPPQAQPDFRVLISDSRAPLQDAKTVDLGFVSLRSFRGGWCGRIGGDRGVGVEHNADMQVSNSRHRCGDQTTDSPTPLRKPRNTKARWDFRKFVRGLNPALGRSWHIHTNLQSVRLHMFPLSEVTKAKADVTQPPIGPLRPNSRLRAMDIYHPVRALRTPALPSRKYPLCRSAVLDHFLPVVGLMMSHRPQFDKAAYHGCSDFFAHVCRVR